VFAVVVVHVIPPPRLFWFLKRLTQPLDLC